MIFYAKDFGILPDSETAKSSTRYFQRWRKRVIKNNKIISSKKKKHFVKSVNCKNLVIEQ